MPAEKLKTLVQNVEKVNIWALILHQSQIECFHSVNSGLHSEMLLHRSSEKANWPDSQKLNKPDKKLGFNLFSNFEKWKKWEQSWSRFSVNSWVCLIFPLMWQRISTPGWHSNLLYTPCSYSASTLLKFQFFDTQVQSVIHPGLLLCCPLSDTLLLSCSVYSLIFCCNSNKKNSKGSP